MSEGAATELRPLKTWSHLAGQRRRPSEYEIVSTKLHWHTRHGDEPWDVAHQGFMADWYRKYRNNSAVQHENWDSFRDPDELVYRTYNILQDGQETYVDGLLEQYSGEEQHDSSLSPDWVEVLATLYSPGRYLQHTVQMASAYLVHIAPASTISNCAAFQAADAFRWLSRIAYRTRELSNAHPGAGFGRDERSHWEGHPAWQGFRELLERTLVAYDWAETFTALNVVVKPAIDEAFLRQFAVAARRHGDSLLSLLADAALRDSERSRRWTGALVEMMLAAGNQPVLQDWLDKWVPLGEQAIEAFCTALPDNPEATKVAIERSWAFRAQLGFEK